MSDRAGTTDDDEPDVHELNVVEGDTSPKLSLLRAIADLEGADETDLPSLYPCIDEMIEKLFADPPSSEAQAELEFSYTDYRITLFQDGLAVLQRRE